MRLDKKKTVNFHCSMDAPIGGDDDELRLSQICWKSEESWDDHSKDDVILLVQNYINRNKIIEAIMIDNIAFQWCSEYYKKTVKTDTSKYTEYSSEFWP